MIYSINVINQCLKTFNHDLLCKSVSCNTDLQDKKNNKQTKQSDDSEQACKSDEVVIGNMYVGQLFTHQY